MVRRGGAKPVYLAPPGTSDVGLLSYAENLFWCDIMMEHARFAGLFLAGPELTTCRTQALQFEGMFVGQLAKLKASGAERDHAKLAAESIDIAKAFVDWKHELHDQARTAKIRTLAFPSFWAHLAQEGERFVSRQGLLSQGQPQLERSEVVGFWSEIVEDHLAQTAHLLDPDEKELVAAAEKEQARFEAWSERRPEGTDAVLAALESLVDWTAALEAGVEKGQVHAALTPALVDHHRREAIKAADELRRVTLVQATR